jgi:hypothetical protein
MSATSRLPIDEALKRSRYFLKVKFQAVQGKITIGEFANKEDALNEVVRVFLLNLASM